MSGTSNQSSFLKTTGFSIGSMTMFSASPRTRSVTFVTLVQKARLTVTAVGDRIWYDPYSTDDDPEHYRASYAATASRAYCGAGPNG
ncbi:hypothetical protein B7435_04240 [Mycolicibacterium peregrinum]|uniref:Uncharacterized protein n=1 Tax=Mycobacterium asiaticum TaxID=1790 RepID=A0A1A3DB59_MYCAS|nr:hypothetical protein A5661_19825 [Mycobacterium asiaticum]ORW53298.1 hypothetical protein AWC21_28285 [Mycolicibacterium peregrinum]RIR49399.1 hypothetical protein D2E37_21935 [Mycobacteroides abscessus]SHQ37422.1 Uncharacterised protein [Mycobacteroides abscessus subsp. abscessus]SKU91501.1 Uncharacterised protein [Mycobacteroides abscessus subsp. bolletii]